MRATSRAVAHEAQNVPDRSGPLVDGSAAEAQLRRTLEAAGLPTTGRFLPKGGWASRAWVGDEFVVRLSDGRARGSYAHEAEVVAMLAGSDVPHARHIAHGAGPDGPWYVSERLAGRTLHDAWPDADAQTRREIVESLGVALRSLHRVSAPADLRPPWLADALAGGSWPSYHPPVISAALAQVEAARKSSTNSGLLDELADWVRERMSIFTSDALVLVHGDVHGSNVIVEQGRVTGLIDFAEALAQPADAELDTILRWCSRPEEFPPTPNAGVLAQSTLAKIPRWLRESYPELFEYDRLRDRLNFYDMCVELAIFAHHPSPVARSTAEARLTLLLSNQSHLDRLALW